MMLFKGWPPQYFWAMRKGDGGGGSSSIVVVPTDSIIIPITQGQKWVYNNTTGYPVFVQTFDETGDEMLTDVTG